MLKTILKTILDTLILTQKTPRVKPIFISFKTKRIENEFAELINKNNDLYDLLLDLSIHVKKTYNKTITITGLFRTQKEQDSIYKNDPKYKKKPFKSPHQFFHAVDLRTSTFTPLEITKITDYLNDKYNPTNYYKFTALRHDIGLGDHWHIQFVKK